MEASKSRPLVALFVMAFVMVTSSRHGDEWISLIYVGNECHVKARFNHPATRPFALPLASELER
jgi:hypothetical protein